MPTRDLTSSRLAGVQLWRGSTWGHALGGIVLVKVTLTGLTLASMTALGAAWAGSLVPFDAFLLVLFGLMGVIGPGLGRAYAGLGVETRPANATVMVPVQAIRPAGGQAARPACRAA